MVEIEEITNTPTVPTPSRSEELLLDADEIEEVAKTVERPTARMQLESLAKKIRREASALQVVERQQQTSSTTTTSTPTPASVPVPPPTPPKPAVVISPTTTSSNVTYTSIDRFSFDAGGYDDQFITLYVPLPGVGKIPKEQITCHFEKTSFDLIVKDLDGKTYRLKKDQLEHDIVIEKSKKIIKADKVIIKLAKIKKEYGSYEYWSKLTDPKRGSTTTGMNANKKMDNPAASINELMKEMYDNGDDKMRKMIGETMLKQHRGELGKGSKKGGPGGGLGLDDDENDDDLLGDDDLED